jgi:succinate dehydrogenase/fumarate reductase cytochrome b subunit
MEPARTPSTAARWARLQAISGLAFSIFLLMHLANTLAALRGPAAYDGLQRVLRLYYQNPLVEILGIAVALTVHVTASIVRIRMRRAGSTPGEATATPPLRMRLHRYSAYYLLVFIVGHIGATRGPQLLYGIAPGFAGLSFTLTHYGFYFYPYYALLALAGLYHGVNGILLALGTLAVRVPPVLRKGPGFVTPIAIVGVGLLVSLLALGGVLFPIANPEDNEFAQLLMSIMG